MVNPVKKILGDKTEPEVVIQNISDVPPVPDPVTGEYTPKNTSDVLFRHLRKKTIGR